MHELSNRQLGILGLVLIGIAILALLLSVQLAPSQNPPSAASHLPPQTIPSAAVLQQLKNSSGFQYLVSYTNDGFEPSTLTVKKADTVRFVDNSSGELWVASAGEDSAQIYPGTSSCGGSAFDSCGPLQHGDFWEFTFDQKGTWHYENNGDTSNTGTIIVQ